MLAMVTGGAGFVGSHVVDKLRERHIDVRIFDMVYPTFRKDVEYYQGTILELEQLRYAMAGVDVVFHLAAVADVKDVLEEPYRAEALNTRGTINVLEAARLAKVGRIVYASTVWVYSDTPAAVVDEDTPLAAPSHLYTATKIASEFYCRAYSNLYGLETVILRYGIPYGPRARGGAVLPIFVDNVLQGKPITIAGDGSQYRKFVYVEDLALGNVLALKEIAANKVYNLDGQEKITILQIAETVKKILGRGEIVFVGARQGDFSGKDVKTDRAREELGWEATTTYEEGVKRYVDWYLETQKQTRGFRPV